MTTTLTQRRTALPKSASAEPTSAWFTASAATLLATLALAPLAFGAVQPWAWASLCIFACAALALWTLGCAALGRVRITWTPLYIVCLAALALVSFQFLLSKTLDPIGTRESLIKLTAYCVIFFLAGQLSSILPSRAWKWFSIAVLVYIFAISVFAIVQFFSNSQAIYWLVQPRYGGAIFGPYVNRNHYAGLLEILIPLAIGAVASLPERHVKLLGTFAILLSLASVLLSGSRGGTIAVTVELAIVFVLNLRSNVSSSVRRPLLAVLGAAVFAFAFFAWLDPGTVRARWQKTVDSPELAAGSRLAIAADTLQIFRQHPISGIGAGAFEVAYPAHQSWITDDLIDHAHNDFAELIAETGTIGALLLLVALGIFLWTPFRTHGLHAPRAISFSTAAAVAVCGLLVHSYTDFNLHIPANAAWFVFAAALALANSAHVLE